MHEKVKLGIIGCGRVSAAHLEACQNLREQVEIASISDTNEERLVGFGEGTRIKKRYSSYHDLLKDDEVEAVVICLPHHLHHLVTIEALQAGKHVLVEKPMALNYEQAKEMVATADSVKKILMVGQCRRFSNAAMEMKKMTEKGEIGEIFRIIVNFLCYFEKPPVPWWSDKDLVGESLVTILQGSHALDEVCWLINRMPNRVFASSFKWRFTDDDETDIFLEYKKITASVHLSLNTRPPLIHEVLIIGSEGTIKLSEYNTDKPFSFGYRLMLNGKTLMDGPQQPTNFTLQLEEFINSIRKKREPIANGREVAATTMRLLSAALESISSRKIITLS